MKNTILKKKMPLVAATWTDAFRRVRNRIALVAAAICAAASPLSSFAEAKEATLKTTHSGSAITGFQVLVKLSEGDAYGFSYAEAGGSTATNIWFTSADGATVYPHEIDKWDTSGDSFVWVRLPELASGTTFKMHWSDSSGDVQQPASGNVWDGYVGVWHMNETGTTAEPDKTGHGLNAAPMNDGGTAININSTTGQIGSGRSFATYFNRMKVEGHKNKLTSQSVFTIGGWVCRSSTSQTHPRIFVGNPTNSDRNKWEVFALSDKSYKVTARGGSTETTFDSIQVGSGTWYYLVVVFDGQTATAYCNGTGYSGTIGNSSQGDYFTIGGVKVSKTASGDSRAFLGTFDEVRMYNGALSAERIAADYATMNAPTEFLVPASQPTATWTGAAGDGNPATASNWNYYEGSETPIAKVPDSETIVTIAGNSVNLQIPANLTFACKSFEIGTCTFTADCDWRGLSVTPTIAGTANLNGYVLKLNNLSAVSGATFSGGDGSFVEFVVDESATIANLYEYTYIENIDNLAFSGSAKIRLLKKDGSGTLTVTRLQLGNKRNVDMVQANGTVDLGSSVNKIGDVSGKTSTYTMSGGSLTVAGNSEFVVGASGTGVFNQSGGSVTLNNWFSLGRYGGNGTYTITGGSLTANHTVNPMWIGGDSPGTGTLTIDPGATVTLKGGIDNGRYSGATGHIILNGGTLNVKGGSGFNIGRTGTGTFEQNGGTLTANEGGTSGNANNVWRIGWEGKGTGSYTLNDGTAIAKSPVYIGDSGTGTFTQNGGTMTAESGLMFAVGANSKATFTLSGGVLNTKSINKGSGTLNGVTFNGGTIVATNVTDGANFINGLNNVTYGPGGLTLDTAGHNVTMATASGANVTAAAGSTFTKTGSGTLTVAAVPPVGNMVVSNGTLALSASCDNASMLAHRWSFNGEGNDYTDSITGTSASSFGDDATKRATTGGKLVLWGNGGGSASLNLGKGLLGLDDATIEIWASNDDAKHYARVFDYGNGSWASNPGQTDCFLFIWSTGTDTTKDIVQLKKNNTAVIDKSGTMSVMELGKQYYFAFTFKANGDGSTTVKWMRRDADTGALERSEEATVSDWTLATLFAKNPDFWLGVSKYSGDSDANASYDEVRIWNGALTDDVIALSAQKGPDATAADIAEIVAASPAGRTLTLESGATLDIGAGNTLKQPVVSGSGTVQNGSLVVTKQFNVTPGQSMTVASGATLDLTGADIVVTGEMPAGGCVIATAPSGGIVPAKPRKLTGDLDGYWLYLKSGKARIGKHPGVTIIVH